MDRRDLDQAADTIGWLIGAFIAAGAMVWAKAVRRVIAR